jgi:Na+/melibiose symporter-like transporter
VVPLSLQAKLVLAVTGASILSYPVLTALEQPIWPVAALAAAICVGAALSRGVRLPAIAHGVSWELLPFLFGVLVLATALSQAGVTDQLRALYAASPWPQPTVGVVAALGAASRYGVAVHFYKYNMGDKDLTTLFRSIGVVAAMLGALSTPVAGRLLGKSRALGVCVLLVGVSSMLMHFASPQRIWIAYSSTIICEFFGGVVITMFFAMLGDTADFNEWKHGRRATGIIYAAGSIALKTGFAFGGLIMAGVLGYYGYQANVEQSARGLFGISMAANVVPGILYCLAAIPMFFYPLTTAKLEEIKLDLERRRGVISAG